MSILSRVAVLGACAGVVIGCGSSTEPSLPATGNGRFPTLLNGGGRLLTPLRLVVVVAANDSLRDSLFAFAKALPTSQWWPQVATSYGVSPTATAFTVSGPAIAPGTQLGLADVFAYVQTAAIDSAGFSPDGRTVYLIFLPPGVACTGSVRCAINSAFHVIFGNSDALALVPRNQSLAHSMMEEMTLLASHEIIEAATDPLGNAWRLVSGTPPWTGSPWGLDDGGTFEENADMCEDTRYLDGGFYYQRIFTNQAAALGGDPCVPTIPTPYFNVTTTKDWYATTTGDVNVPVTGWSVGAVADWEFGTSFGPQTPSLAAPSISITCPDTVFVAGFCTMNNAKTAMFHIVLPPGSASKSFFTIRVNSGRINPNGQVGGPGEDYFHHLIFGVYVP